MGGPVLELACGSGRVLVPIAQAGYITIGLDRDASMLAALQINLQRSPKSTVYLLLADLAAFRLDTQFPFILIACNTLSTLQAPVRQATLSCVRRHLSTGGVFAAKLPNPSVLTSLADESYPEMEEIFTHPLTGNPVEVYSGWEKSESQVIFKWIYVQKLPDGRYTRLQIENRQELIALETILAEFRYAGLLVKQVLGDFNGSEFGKDSPHLILVASC